MDDLTASRVDPGLTYHGVEVEAVSTPALVWLVETFGPAGRRWFVVNNIIYFSKDRDRMMFEIGWCR